MSQLLSKRSIYDLRKCSFEKKTSVTIPSFADVADGRLAVEAVQGDLLRAVNVTGCSGGQRGYETLQVERLSQKDKSVG